MITQEQLQRKIRERPSSMDRALLCPASLYPSEGEPLIEIVGDDAGPIGQAAHEIFKAVAKGEDYNIEEIALKWGVGVDDLEYLRYTAYKSVETLNDQFDVEKWLAEEEQASVPIEGLKINLGGTPDLSGLISTLKTLVVVDYKSGRATMSHINQIKSYARNKLSQHPEIDKVIGVIVWARDLEFQVWTWTREELDIWVREANETIYGWDGVSYTVGEHCTFCRRAASCQARQLELNAAYTLIKAQVDDDESPVGLEMITSRCLAQMYEASKAIPKLIEDWRKRLKEQVKIEGDLDMGDGKVLTLKEKNGASVIDTNKAAILLDTDYKFDIAEILALCKMSKTALETEIGNRAAKGCKGKDKKALVEALKEAGALHQPKTHVLAVVDAPAKQLPEGGE